MKAIQSSRICFQNKALEQVIDLVKKPVMSSFWCENIEGILQGMPWSPGGKRPPEQFFSYLG